MDIDAGEQPQEIGVPGPDRKQPPRHTNAAELNAPQPRYKKQPKRKRNHAAAVPFPIQ